MQKTPSASVGSSWDLPDVNVWLALAVEDHPAHGCAVEYWRADAARGKALCRITALGLVRLSTSRTVMRGHPLSPSDAWRAYQAIRRLPEVEFAAEPSGCEAALGRWVQQEVVTANHWTDAYLGAFAVAGGMRLVTMDRGFTRFEGLDALILDP